MTIWAAVCLIMGCFFCTWKLRESNTEPNISFEKVDPFKLRSPFSVSKHYKSPDDLDKIIEKRSPKVSITKYYTLNFDININFFRYIHSKY